MACCGWHDMDWQADHTHKEICNLIQEDEEGWRSRKALKNRIRFGGRIQRHPEEHAWAVVNYRDMAWWRYRQLNIRPGSSKFRHPGRYTHLP